MRYLGESIDRDEARATAFHKRKALGGENLRVK
jgi:hypothetical protein